MTTEKIISQVKSQADNARRDGNAAAARSTPDYAAQRGAARVIVNAQRVTAHLVTNKRRGE